MTDKSPMMERVPSAYGKFIAWINLYTGNALEGEVIHTFGGVPNWQEVGLVGITMEGYFDGRKYVKLGPFEQAFHKIREAARQGKQEVTLTSKDLEWISYHEICRLQQEAKQKRVDCIVAGMELKYTS